ncbi:MAG: hypothetical protein O2794_01040 [bacterium]|nr:hypothetical protein [bacterium]
MKYFLSVTIFLVLPVFLFAHGGEEHDPIIMTVTDEGFAPSQITVVAGETVTFENDGKEDHWPASDVHPTHEAYSALDPRRPIIPRASWSFTFEEEGQYTIHDHLFPDFGGLITVKPEGTVIVRDGLPEQKNIEAPPEEKEPGFFARKWVSIKRFLGWVFGRNDNNQEIDKTEETQEKISDEEVVLIQEVRQEIDTHFTEPTTYNKDFLYKSFDLGCTSSNHGCISNSVKDLTRDYGPVAAVELLEIMVADGRVSRSINDHQLSHEIGREAARSYGVNSEAFLLCPMSAFNGGCQHGFFEYVLGRTESTSQAADLICKSLGDTYSNKFKFYCYHGVGHGVMMQQAYDLQASLDTCDSLDGLSAQDGCWQGVFMENTNAGMSGEARAGLFSLEDPLAPCNQVEDKYRNECYLNHAGYLMKFFGNDIRRGAHSCLEAGEWIPSCLQSLGLMVTNPSWQGALLPGAAQLGEVRSAWELCRMFPTDHISQCVQGGVDNIINFDEFDVGRADEFCSIIDTQDQELCFRGIGRNLRNDSINQQQVTDACNLLSTQESRDWCLLR